MRFYGDPRKLTYKMKSITDKEGYFIFIKESIHEEGYRY